MPDLWAFCCLICIQARTGIQASNALKRFFSYTDEPEQHKDEAKEDEGTLRTLLRSDPVHNTVRGSLSERRMLFLAQCSSLQEEEEDEAVCYNTERYQEDYMDHQLERCYFAGRILVLSSYFLASSSSSSS